MSAQRKREHVQAIYHRYRRAARQEKQRILDEFCEMTTYHRKHAIRVLNGPAPGAARPAPPAGRCTWRFCLRAIGEGIRRLRFLGQVSSRLRNASAVTLRTRGSRSPPTYGEGTRYYPLHFRVTTVSLLTTRQSYVEAEGACAAEPIGLDRIDGLSIIAPAIRPRCPSTSSRLTCFGHSKGSPLAPFARRSRRVRRRAS